LTRKKLEKLFVAGFKHRGFAFFDIFSNCHVNLGRKNKMASAMENLNWIDSITVSKTKFEKMSEEERKGLSQLEFFTTTMKLKSIATFMIKLSKLLKVAKKFEIYRRKDDSN
jgi:pyruvate/2-oxoacid:ferredoxin oxidoreductase beta subunit